MKNIKPIYFFLLFGAAAAWAAPVGSIKGYVRDASGAIVPKAALTLSNEKTGVQQKTVSDATGLYQFLDLNPGSYRVTAEVPGFRTIDVKGVIVLVDQIVQLDLKTGSRQFDTSCRSLRLAGLASDRECSYRNEHHRGDDSEPPVG
jgi:hypothetical protein